MLAIIVICIVPIVVIVLFWMVHVLPEKIAHKRHHPQRDAIQVLCLLSLVFGGMLWPLAWLWAYSKPVLHKLAYGTDKHDDYYAHLAASEGATGAGPACRRDEAQRATSTSLLAKGDAPEELAAIRDQLAALEPRLAASRRQGSQADGNYPARHLQLLRLADLLQVQVAAVERDEPGHGGRDPDRRAHGVDPAAQHLRAVVARRARVPLHGADRLAGARPRDRSADRGGQPPRPQGRRCCSRSIRPRISSR